MASPSTTTRGRACVVAPRFGFAYDVSGAQRMVRARWHRALPRSSGGRHDVLAGGEPGLLDVADGAVRVAAAVVVGARNSGAAAADVGLAVRSGDSLVHPVERRACRWRCRGPRRSTCRMSASTGSTSCVRSAGRTRWTSMPSISGRHFCRRIRIRRWRRAARPARRRIRPICCGRTAASGRSGSTSRTSTKRITRSRRR